MNMHPLLRNARDKQKFKICLISVVDKSYLDEAPLDLLYLADYLVKSKILRRNQIRIIDLDFEDPVKVVKKLKPQLVGLSVITPFYSLAASLATEIKKNCSASLIIGGYHISSLPGKLEQPFDIGVIGEGEETLAELVTAFKKKASVTDKQLSKINGIVFRDKKGELIKTQMRPVLDLNISKPLDWSLLPSEKLYQYQTFLIDGKPQVFKTVRIYSARGCPYNCSFCAHRVVWFGMRFFTAQKVVDEIETLYRDYGVKSFQIMDDTFAISKTRVRELITEMDGRGLLGKVFFSHLFVRANLIDQEFVDLLKEFGAVSVFIGIEFGSERMLQTFKDGKLTNEQVKKATRLFGQANIFVFGSFMLFAPTETKGEVQQTYQLAKWFSEQPNALSLGYSVTTPYPGTKLWNVAVEMKVVDFNNINWDDFLMFDLSSGERDITKIFFYNKLTHEDCERFWDKFAILSNRVQENWENIDGWTEKLIEADYRNQKLRARIALKRRVEDFIDSPQALLGELFTNPNKLYRYFYYLIKDLKRFFKKRDVVSIA